MKTLISITRAESVMTIAFGALLLVLFLFFSGSRSVSAAAICYGEGGTSGPVIACTGNGSDSLDSSPDTDSCYVRIDDGGNGYIFESVPCPSGATSAGIDQFDQAYVGYIESECQALGNITIADNVADEQRAYLQRQANESVNVCMSTISTNIGTCAVGDTGPDCVKTVPIFERFIQIMNLLAAGVGLFITTLIVFRGLQYASARNNPQQVAEAKNGMVQAIIALFVYIFMYAFLQWLIPGGIF